MTIAARSPSNLESESTHGASESARKIADLRWTARMHARANASDWRPLMRSLVEEIAAECRERGWDGYDARPISAEAKTIAQLFIDSMPYHLPPPDPTPNPDGEIAFVWDFGPNQLLTISIDSMGSVSFASISRKGARHYGREPFVGEIPDVIRMALEEVCKRADIAG